MLLVWATGYPGASHEELEKALQEELEDLTSVAAEEVERAIAVTETDLVLAIEGAGERADLLSMCELYFSDPERLNREIDRLRQVTPDQIRAFAEERLGPNNRAVVVYEPEAGR
jgi:predicted Zn-dependent peptidase